MGIDDFDILQLLQDLLDNLNSPKFLDAGVCEGLPEDEKEPYPVGFGKEPFTGHYWASEHLLACLLYVRLEERSIAENYKNLNISNLGAPSVVFTLNQIQGLIEVYLRVRYLIESTDLYDSKFKFAEDHSFSLALGKGREIKGLRDIFAAIKSQCASFEDTCFLRTELELYQRLRHVRK